ncbi:MAG: hypothetical protein R2710_03980 [Acidimicrobiales bacterium]
MSPESGIAVDGRSVGLFTAGAYYLIDMGNDPGFVLTRTTGVRLAFAGSGLMAAAVLLFSFAAQLVNRFIWAVGTSAGVHAPMSPLGRAPRLKVPGPPADISLSVTPHRLGLKTLVFSNAGRHYSLTVSRSNAARVVETFNAWAATHPSPTTPSSAT